MSLWKVKFDHKNGELRKCKQCDKDFHAKKPTWRCNLCTSKINFDKRKSKYEEGIMNTGKWIGMPMKKPYPFSNRTSESNNRFSRIRRELRKAWEGGREELDKHYAKQLKEIEENGILEWILDRRANDDLPNGQKKAKSKTQTNIEFPDTRGYHEY
jgi:DNA-directed RNA polymerase subunit RPC12/RpoP